MLSLFRRTHLYYINRTISFTCPAPFHRSYCHPDRFSTAPAISSAPAFFSAPARSYEPGIPSELGIPGSDLPDCGIHPARFLRTPLAFPWRFPRYVATRLPRKGELERGFTPPSDLPETSGSPTWVSAAVTRTFQIQSANRYMSTPDSSGLRGLPNRTPFRTDQSLPTGPVSPSDILNCAAPAHLRTILIYGLTFHNHYSAWNSCSLPPVTENSTREKVFFCY